MLTQDGAPCLYCLEEQVPLALLAWLSATLEINELDHRCLFKLYNTSLKKVKENKHLFIL